MDEDLQSSLLAAFQSRFGYASTPQEDLPPDTKVLRSAEHVNKNAIDVSLSMSGTKEAARVISALMKQKSYSADRWSEHELHPKSRNEEVVNFIFTLDLLNFSFWVDDQPGNHTEGETKWEVEFRGKRWTRYWALVASLQRALEERIEITTPDFWTCEEECTLDLLRHIFRSENEVEIPLLEERLEILREAGRVLYTKYQCRPLNLIKASKNSTARLVNILRRDFPSFNDTTSYEDERVYFLKRAQILAADLWACFSSTPEIATMTNGNSSVTSTTNDDGTMNGVNDMSAPLPNGDASTSPTVDEHTSIDQTSNDETKPITNGNSTPTPPTITSQTNSESNTPGDYTTTPLPSDTSHPTIDPEIISKLQFHDINALTIFPDYRIPQALFTLGVLTYSPPLLQAMREKRQIPSGSNWEIEIRGCSIWGVEMIKREIEGLIQKELEGNMSGLGINGVEDEDSGNAGAAIGGLGEEEEAVNGLDDRRREEGGMEVNAVLIDFFLYDLMKEKEDAFLKAKKRGEAETNEVELIPHHRTRSIWY